MKKSTTCRPGGVRAAVWWLHHGHVTAVLAVPGRRDHCGHRDGVGAVSSTLAAPPCVPTRDRPGTDRLRDPARTDAMTSEREKDVRSRAGPARATSGSPGVPRSATRTDRPGIPRRPAQRSPPGRSGSATAADTAQSCGRLVNTGRRILTRPPWNRRIRIQAEPTSSPRVTKECRSRQRVGRSLRMRIGRCASARARPPRFPDRTQSGPAIPIRGGGSR